MALPDSVRKKIDRELLLCNRKSPKHTFLPYDLFVFGYREYDNEALAYIKMRSRQATKTPEGIQVSFWRLADAIYCDDESQDQILLGIRSSFETERTRRTAVHFYQDLRRACKESNDGNEGHWMCIQSEDHIWVERWLLGEGFRILRRGGDPIILVTWPKPHVASLDTLQKVFASSEDMIKLIRWVDLCLSTDDGRCFFTWDRIDKALGKNQRTAFRIWVESLGFTTYDMQKGFGANRHFKGVTTPPKRVFHAQKMEMPPAEGPSQKVRRDPGAKLSLLDQAKAIAEDGIPNEVKQQIRDRILSRAHEGYAIVSETRCTHGATCYKAPVMDWLKSEEFTVQHDETFKTSLRVTW